MEPKRRSRTRADLTITVVFALTVALPLAADPPGVQLGASVTVANVDFDYHRGSGNLFAAMVDGYWTDEDDLTVFMSTDGGLTWSQIWQVTDVLYVTDVELAVVADRVYVVYTSYDLEDGQSILVARFSALTGAVDQVYTPSKVADTSASSVHQMVLLSNADDLDNRLHLLTRDTDHTLRWFWVDQDGCLGCPSWNEISTGVTNVAGGLDATWNDNFTTYKVFASWVDDDSCLRILCWAPGNFVVSQYDLYPLSNTFDTSISAYADHVLCVGGTSGGASEVVYYYATNSGSSWYTSTLNTDGDDLVAAAVSLRGGSRMAAVYSEYAYEAPGPGELDHRRDWLRLRDLDPSNPWQDPVVVYEEPSVRPVALKIMHLLPKHPGNLGSVTVAGDQMRAFFSEPDLIHRDGFESGNVSGWSTSVP